MVSEEAEVLLIVTVNTCGKLTQPFVTVRVPLYSATGAAAGTTSVIGEDPGIADPLTFVNPAVCAAAL
jgi:hypothetical protein